jgi:hypothetical protein
MIEFIQTILNIDSDQDLFCKLSRSTFWAFMFASVATLLAITVDRCFYIVKPLKYPLIVTKRRVFTAVSVIWLTACCPFIVSVVHFQAADDAVRSFCYLNDKVDYFLQTFTVYFPLTLIVILNVWILIVAEKQRKRIFTQTVTNRRNVNGFFQALKAVKTFSIVVAVLTFCVLAPTVVALGLNESSCQSFLQFWYTVFHYEFYGMNSVVNVFIYGMRHTKYRKATGQIIFQIRRFKISAPNK